MFYGLGNDDFGVAVSWNDVQIQETVSNRPVRTSLLFFVCDAEKRYGGSEGLAMAHFLPFVQKLNGYFSVLELSQLLLGPEVLFPSSKWVAFHIPTQTILFGEMIRNHIP